MPMPKARGDVVEIDRTDKTVLLRGEGLSGYTDDSQWFTLADLNRCELMRAAAFAVKDAGKLTHLTNDALRAMVETGAAVAAKDYTTAEVEAFTLAETPAQFPTEPTYSQSLVAPPVGSATNAAAAKMAEALSLFAEATTQPVDEAQVREIVAESMDERGRAIAQGMAAMMVDHEAKVAEQIATLAPQVTSIEVNGLPAVTIEGATHHQLPKVIRAATLRLNILLVGPMGTGKSTLAHQVAQGLGLDFVAQSFGPDTMSSALFGYKDAHGNYHRTLFRDAYELGMLFLGDEIDNGHASILTGLNQALSNGTCAFPDGMVQRHPDFLFIGTANTWGTGATAEYVGRNTLDAAFLDRFGSRLPIDIDEAMETSLVKARSTRHADEVLRKVRAMRKNIADNGLKVNLSPRASFDAATLMEAGATWDEVLDERLVAGVPDEQRRKILSGV